MQGWCFAAYLDEISRYNSVRKTQLRIDCAKWRVGWLPALIVEGNIVRIIEMLKAN